jgi:hypothetical protein
MNRFQVLERDGWNADAMHAFLSGGVIGVIFRSVVPIVDCEVAFQNFRRHPDTRQRSGDATGLYLGTFHWGKHYSEYADECSRYSSAVESFIDMNGLRFAWQTAIHTIEACADARGGFLRPARWADSVACWPLVRLWQGKGRFSLVPHEDSSQCFIPFQRGFEIQRRFDLLASMNLCIRNDGGGDLIVWDVQPDESMKANAHVGWQGGPYARELVSGFQRLDISISAGDLYFFDGSYIHAVGETTGERATVSTLIGDLGDDIICWT